MRCGPISRARPASPSADRAALGEPNLNEIDQLWDYERPAESEARFRALLPEIGDAAGRAELLTQIARALGLQRQFDSAHRTLDEAQDLCLAPDGAPGLARARLRYLLERGRVFNSSGQLEQARPLFLEAWEQASAEDQDDYAVDAAHMLAILSPPAEQFDWHRRALECAERSPDPRARRWLGTLYNNLGWTLHDQGEYDRALETFQKALAFRQVGGQARETRIARWCVARTLRSLGRLEEALAMQQALLAEWEVAGEPDGYVFEELGECLLALGRAQAARPYFARAHAELSRDPGLAAGEPARLERLKDLGAPKKPGSTQA